MTEKLSCRPIAVLLLIVGMAFSPSPRAGGGDDHTHGDEPTMATQSAAPRVVAATDKFELVGVLDATGITLYLDRPDTTEPVTDATIAVDVDDKSLTAGTQDGGTFRIDGDWATRGPTHDFVFTVTAGETVDLLSGTLELGAVAADDHGHLPWGWIVGIGAGVLALLVGSALLRQRRSALAAVALLGCASLLFAAATYAGGGDDHTHGDEEPVAEGGYVLGAPDSPRRLPNGSLFVPKPTQRLLALRTTVATTATAPQTTRLLGRLVADPARAGLVQSVSGGRVIVASGGLPALGDSVRAGELLAYVEPPLSGGDVSSLLAERSRLTTEIDIAERRYARLQRLADTVARREIEDVRAELEGLHRRRAALDSGSARREALLAPVSGKLVRMNAIAGQVVAPETVLFEILAPGAYLVEASSYAAQRPGEKASARLPDGRTLALTLVGSSAALDNQALTLRYRVDAVPEDIALYTPVTVLQTTAATVEGIPLPRGAVVQTTAGSPVVWIKVAPETFQPREVRITDIDGEQIMVVAGLKSPARVVVAAAGLINQIR